MLFDRSPYNRTPFTRQHIVGVIYEVDLHAVAIADADIKASLAYLVYLLGKAVARGRRLSRRPRKLLRAKTRARGRIRRHILKTLLAKARANAAIKSMSKILYRTLKATATAGATMKKNITKKLQAIATALAARLRIEKVRGWAFNGVFAPGQRIKVDRDNLTVTRDGVNVIDKIEGDPSPFLEPGENELQYTDAEAERDIKLRLLYRGRWL